MERNTPGSVCRVRVHWQEGKWNIFNKKLVSEMIIPESQLLPKISEDQEIIGFWFEVNDLKGNLLYRQIIDNPMKQYIEIPTDDGRFMNVPRKQNDITFEVLIPENPKNATLSFFGPADDKVEKLIELDLRDRESGD
jgi:hypothetical protein